MFLHLHMNWVMHSILMHLKDVHPLNRSYAMNVAETASTFAEMIVSDAAVNNANSEEEKLVLLEDKIQRSVAFFMNIHARFLFETRFYEERKKGMVGKTRLNELMEEAQKEAYADSLRIITLNSGDQNYISLLQEYLFITSRIHLAIYSHLEFMRKLLKKEKDMRRNIWRCLKTLAQ